MSNISFCYFHQWRTESWITRQSIIFSRLQEVFHAPTTVEFAHHQAFDKPVRQRGNMYSVVYWIYILIFDFIECFTTTFLRAHSWLNWVDEDDDEHDEVGFKEKPEDTRYIKKITSK